MKKILYFMAVIALAACGDNDDIDIPRTLTVEVTETPMQDENASAREMTRAGDATTTSSLTSFKMISSKSKTEEIMDFSKNGEGKWPTNVWPYDAGDSEKLNFFAYSAGTINWGSAPYLAFTTEGNVASQKDLLVAKHDDISRSDNGGKVSLIFDHACAAVQFYVYKVENATFNVSSIILRNVKNSGYYYYNNAENERWVLDGTTTYYTLNTASINVSTTYERLNCGWLYLIPQSKSGITIDVTYTKNEDNPTTKTLTLPSGNWEAGKKYTVNIRIGNKAT